MAESVLMVRGLEAYGKFRNAFAELLDPRFYSIEWLDQGVASGAAVAMGNEDACIVVELKRYPAGAKEVHGLCAAGDMREILKLIELAEEWGRLKGAIVATIASREAWGKILHTRGYRPYQLTIQKELAHGS
jgi:hypothetical protein